MSLSWDGEAVARAVERAAEDAVRAMAEHVLTEANKRAPIDPGDELEESSRVSTDGTTAAVSYDVPYAVVQHERLDYRHDPGREAKWLERAGNREAGRLVQLAADEIRRQLGT